MLPSLFGATGLTLQQVSSHYAHFVGNAQTVLSQGVGTAIATQLAVLPLISPSSGFTYKYDSGTGVFVRSTASFGPIYTERAETIGRGKMSFGVSYQRFRFGSLDGIDLHNVPAVFNHEATSKFYGVDVIQTSNRIDLNMDQSLLYGTVGITDRLDVSVAVPIVSVRMNAISTANILQLGGPGSTSLPDGTNPHVFDNGTLRNVYGRNGSASGIGDVTVRVKANLLQGRSVRVALALDVRTPSGDARKFLGSGATGIKPFIAISSGDRFSPHINIGYQWNGQSILAGNITGATFSEDTSGNPTITNGPATKASLPGQLIYSLGADYGVTKRVTFAFDYLGQTLFNAPRVFSANILTPDETSNPPGCAQFSACGLPSRSLKTLTGGSDNVGLNSAATGVKVNLFGNLLLTGDVLFRLDNKGLRQNVTPLVALSYAFGH